ncbi:hypothetical protein ABZS77_06370 [Micromonospora sp. NPDC005298]|uniref:hypothetical protein n=1 Tax=Micromonospora sp. NPDC005298 TaxID=3156873 RepID=UPI0033B35A4D
MADEDRMRADSRAGDGVSDAPTSHRRPAVTAGQPRVTLRRLAGSHQRRRLMVAGLAVLACVAGLGAYLGTRNGPESGDGPAGRAGVPVGASRPTGFPGAEGRTGDVGPATPGLRPRQRPPSPEPTPSVSPTVAPPAPPAPPALSVSQAEAPGEIDLTATGQRDWMHWGQRGTSVVRKRGGSGEIVDAGGRGARVGWDGNQELVSWRDGTPERSVRDSSNGVYTCGAGNGFSLAVAGSGEPRTVQLYAGTWMARGRLDVRLSTGGPVSTVRLEDPYTSRSAQFTIRFQLPKGARLLVNWTVEKVFTPHCGNVALQAVAVR